MELITEIQALKEELRTMEKAELAETAAEAKQEAGFRGFSFSDIPESIFKIIVGFFGFFWIIFLVSVIIILVDIFLSGSGGGEEEGEECEIELDEDGNPVEGAEEACEATEEDEEGAEGEDEEGRRLESIPAKMRKFMGDSLNIQSLNSTDDKPIVKRFKKGKRKVKKAKKKTKAKIYKFN